MRFKSSSGSPVVHGGRMISLTAVLDIVDPVVHEGRMISLTPVLDIVGSVVHPSQGCCLGVLSCTGISTVCPQA